MRSALSATGVTTLRETAIHWVDGGPLTGWAVVHSRVGRPVGIAGQPARFMFTKASSSATDPVIQRWTEHLSMVVVADDSPLADQVFCRIVVRQRSIAINAAQFADVASAQKCVRSITGDASTLHVAFAFMPGEPIPMWVVRQGDAPLFVGLPQHHLARATDSNGSLAAMLSAARVKGQVHEAGAERDRMLTAGRPGQVGGSIPRPRMA